MLIAGAGGHAIEVLDILLETVPKEEIIFFDDVSDVVKIHNFFPVLKTKEEVLKQFMNSKSFCLGVGTVSARKLLCEMVTNWGGVLNGVRAGSSEVSEYSMIGKGVDICKQSFVSSLSTIGYGTLINNGAKVHHHVKIGEFCEISPAAVLLGRASVGNECSIGAGSIILPKISICDQVTVGSGAVVTCNIIEPGIYVGIPARKVK
jgi:sugar O-acyltransferase (sialic acid O-acetyltransferase NeuD family)